MAICVNNVEEFDDIRIIHFLEKRDLTDGGAGHAFVFGFKTNLLEGNYSGGVCEVTSFVDDPIGT